MRALILSAQAAIVIVMLAIACATEPERRAAPANAMPPQCQSDPPHVAAIFCDRIYMEHYECAICDGKYAGCVTKTSVYCAPSCDAQECQKR